MTSKRLKTNNLVLKFTASLFQDGRPFCVTNSCSRKTTFVSFRCQTSCRVDSSCSRQVVLVSRFFDAVSQDRDVEITSTANDNETYDSTPAIAPNLEIEWTSTLQQNHLQAAVPRPPAHPEGSPQVCDPRSEEISSQSLGSLVNPVNTDERKEVETAAGNSMRSASRSEIGYSQASRQENVSMAAGDSMREDPTPNTQ